MPPNYLPAQGVHRGAQLQQRLVDGLKWFVLQQHTSNTASLLTSLTWTLCAEQAGGSTPAACCDYREFW
eukprot:4443911-Alexandrium_andersonii.AAC.1